MLLKDWCTKLRTTVSSHTLDLFVAIPSKVKEAIKVIGETIPKYYAAPPRIAGLLQMLGKRAAAKFVKGKLPTLPNIRSGDLGEILCNSYVTGSTSFKLGIKRLRWKDHRNMSMRGEDVLAFKLDPKTSNLSILKAEVKSGAVMTSAVVTKARAALSKDNELPSPHAMAFVADRLDEAGHKVLRDAIDNAQLKKGLRPSQVTHMLFTFSGNDPTSLLTANLKAYSGSVQQRYVALHVPAHKTFIKAAFEMAAK